MNDKENTIRVNMSLLNESAFVDIQKSIPNVEKCSGYAWILGIRLKDEKHHIALYPISSINPLAPPDFFLTHEACTSGVNNKKRAGLINKKLKKAINIISIKDTKL